MASPGSKNLILSAFVIVLIGATAGLIGALAFKKLPAGLFLGGKPVGVEAPEPASLFYSVVGDSPSTNQAGNGPQVAQGNLNDAKYTIEIAKLNTRDQAETLIKGLAQKGLDAYYTPLLKDGRVIYRVRYGIFDTEVLARSAMKSIQAKHNLKTTLSRM